MNTDRMLKELGEGQHIKRVILYYGDQAPSDIIEESDSFKDWDLLLAYLIHTNVLDEEDVISELWGNNDHTEDLEDYCNLAHYLIAEMYIDYGTLTYLIQEYCEDILIKAKGYGDCGRAYEMIIRAQGGEINNWYEYIPIDNTLWGKY